MWILSTILGQYILKLSARFTSIKKNFRFLSSSVLCHENCQCSFKRSWQLLLRVLRYLFIIELFKRSFLLLGVNPLFLFMHFTMNYLPFFPAFCIQTDTSSPTISALLHHYDVIIFWPKSLNTITLKYSIVFFFPCSVFDKSIYVMLGTVFTGRHFKYKCNA